MCITDKAKETSCCADLFRCRAVCFAWSARLFALSLGWLSLSSACLDATTISHASGAWSRIFHLMQVCCLPLCPGRPVRCVLRAWLLGVCVGLALLCALPPGLPVPLWPGAVGLCSALLPGAWACCACPVGLGLYVGLVYGSLISPCYMGLFCGLVFRALYGPLKKGFIFAWIFRLCISGLFSGLCFRLKISGQIFRASKAGFFLRIFSRRFFRRKFPGYFFRVLFSGIFPGLIFAAVSGFLFFLDVIFIRFPVLRDEFFHVVKFQELVHGGLVDSVALAF